MRRSAFAIIATLFSLHAPNAACDEATKHQSIRDVVEEKYRAIRNAPDEQSRNNATAIGEIATRAAADIAVGMPDD